jgi:hypothetical protein
MVSKKKARSLSIVTMLLLGSMAGISLGQTAQAAQVNNPTDTATNTPFAPTHPLISEFRSRGPNGAEDEFVEIYNPGSAAVNLGGWSLSVSSGCGRNTTLLLTFPDNTVLAVGQHYLAASSANASVSGADQTFAPGLDDDGGVGLINPDGIPVDQAGMCINTLFREGTNLAPLAGDTNQSYERSPGGATACYDTDNNASDFTRISPSNPQNMASPISICNGVRTSTPTRTVTVTKTSTPTQTASLTRRYTPIPDLVVINEFLPRPQKDWNEDGVVDEGDEFIEIINLGTRPINLNGWELDGGANTTSYSLPNLFINQGQILVFFHFETGIPLSDGGGAVRLVKPTGATGDIYRYPPVTVADRSWCRLTDRNHGNLALACDPTPGRPNIPFEPGLSTPEGQPEPIAVTPCELPDTIPPDMVVVECGNTGAGVWNAPQETRVWLKPRGKWTDFLE